MPRLPEHGVEEEFCTNSRRWMFKRGYQIINDCPGNLFGSETSCPINCGYLEIRTMPPEVKRLWNRLYGGQQVPEDGAASEKGSTT